MTEPLPASAPVARVDAPAARSLPLSPAMADSEGPVVSPPAGDPARPRYLGLWVAGILLVALFGGAMGVVADVIYKLLLGI